MRRVCFTSFAFFIWLTVGCVAATKHKVVAKLPMPMTAPLFLENDMYSSTLYLVNSLNFGVDTVVTVYDMSGALLTNKHYFLGPNSQQAIGIKQVLNEGGLYAEAGSIEVISPQNSSALLGQLSITRSGTGQSYLDEELFMATKRGSQTLRAVIDSPQNSPIVAITNVSSTITQTLHIKCIWSSGGTVSKLLTVQPKQTQLVRSCSTKGDVVFSPNAADSQFVFTDNDNLGTSGKQVAGVSITSDGPPSDIAAFGFVEHNDEYGSYFSEMNFVDPSMLASTATVYTGVPIGKSRLLPGGDYIPQVALTNFTDTTQSITVKATTTVQGSSEQHEVTTFSIPGNSSQMTELKGLSGDPGWQNSFIVEATGNAGDVLSKMMFRSHAALPNIELIGKDEKSPYTGGDHPWSTENGTLSTLFLFNHSTALRSVAVRIGSGDSLWLQNYDLKPNETRAISINSIQSSRTPDMSGRLLTLTLLNGEVAWWASSQGSPQVTGRVVQINKGGSMARNFSCPIYYELCNVYPSVDPFAFPLSQSSSVSGVAIVCTDTDGPDPCDDNGQHTTMNKTVSWSWSTNNSSIAQITSGAGSQTSTWQGMAAGNAQSSLTVSGAGFSCSGSGGVTVQTPTSASTMSSTRTTYNNQTVYAPNTSPPQVLANNAYGYSRTINYQILDQNTQPINSTYTVHEVIVDIYSNFGSNSHTGDNSSNSNGIFTDFVALFGSSAPPANACAYAKQTFSVQGASIRVNCIHYAASDATVTDITSSPNSCTSTCP